jgi:Pin2-interacting protein X1
MTIVDTKDTRNEAWATNKSAFGYKMLAKMGWSEGKGLGKNDQGQANHLRAVRRAEDTLGLGAEIDSFGSSQWESNKNNFHGVLQSLKATHAVAATAIESIQEEETEEADGLVKTTTITKDSKKKKSSRKDKKGKRSNSKKLVLAQNCVTAGHSAKWREAKDLSTKSDSEMAGILGMNVEEYRRNHKPQNEDEENVVPKKTKSKSSSKKRSRAAATEGESEMESKSTHPTSIQIKNNADEDESEHSGIDEPRKKRKKSKKSKK